MLPSALGRPAGCFWFHSITSSARTRIVSGTVTPRAFAVLRLTTSSNRDGRSIGRSAGLAPPRMRPTSYAFARPAFINLKGKQAISSKTNCVIARIIRAQRASYHYGHIF
jgi:hypothetical protein